MSYRDRLRKLKLYSLEQRRERYALIHIWKILEELVPDFSIEYYTNARTGHYCIVPKVPSTPSKFRTRFCNSFRFKGAQLFSALPQKLRNLHKVEVNVFKTKLDILLYTILDEPAD
ncbi:Hypothetical predicted protein [Octopus vulgaris]|uniref:Uncharacterized protein n=1 Tax=Octopus vulgaris TaxID=6645 RepID=A0AA36AUS8_OCTVU|nr:Hypothetical predicted protein [Octopus vulgaris]